jgi:hypothetical protein
VPGFSSQGIFLSYRREDAAPYARLLQFHLKARFPNVPVFMDVDSIEPGLDFAEVIRDAVESCAVLVALIGRQWATLLDEEGHRRLDNRDDYVRFEVQTALERGVRVVPVLVDGARPLRQQQLPAELTKLARLNAHELSYGRYEYDADRLVDLIQRVLDTAPGTSSAIQEPSSTVNAVAHAVPQAHIRPDTKAHREAAQQRPEPIGTDHARAIRIPTDADLVAQPIYDEPEKAEVLAEVAEALPAINPIIIELDISGTGVPGSYRVHIVQSPAGEASATSDFDPGKFIERLGDFQQTLLASSVTTRILSSRGDRTVREVGRGLFDALFSQPRLAGVYRASCAVADEREQPLRMVLRLSAPELAALPWEAMFDQAVGRYVCRREPLVRYLPVASSPPPLMVRPPLQILALFASPRGLSALDVEKEKEGLSKALAQPIARGDVVVQWLEHTTWSALQDALLSGTWHVVHFNCHGHFDIDRDEGVFALESQDGGVHRVAAEHLVDLMREARPIPRLVMLNVCESAKSAAALIRGGVNAVTAMQFEISDRAAIAFCRGFYTAVVQGRGVDEAVRSGRVAILGLSGDSLEWIIPTLSLRGRETHLYSVTRSLLDLPHAARSVQE